MKILMINKFLYPNGGSETYVFSLGEYLKNVGHQVEFFGMEHNGRIVGNSANSYTSDMDFHGGSIISKLSYPIKTVYSLEARKKIRAVLENFEPEVCHINNFNFQLTPSIILEIVKWRKASGRKCKIVYTAHDGQLVCPNHLMQNPITGERCQKCFGGYFKNCVKNKCIHSSLTKSLIGAIEGYYWNWRGVYSNIDTIIAPSRFMAECLSTNPILKGKIQVINNFVKCSNELNKETKEDFVLYCGRYSIEKGIKTLLRTIDSLPNIKFVFAGDGPLKNEINKRANAEDKGFLQYNELMELVSKARFSIMPSECFENYPFSVIESIVNGTPVIGANIGGIPELIDEGKTGELFESSNAQELADKISRLFADKERLSKYTINCQNAPFVSIKQYYDKLTEIYSF